MTQEEKDLLLKDLCARLPYEAKLLHIPTNEITILELVGKYFVDGDIHDSIENFKPYLFPLSSMTEEQKYACPIGVANLETFIKNESWTYLELTPDSILRFVDWCNKNHFDYRGLIDKSLALDSTNLGIYE